MNWLLSATCNEFVHMMNMKLDSFFFSFVYDFLLLGNIVALPLAVEIGNDGRIGDTFKQIGTRKHTQANSKDWKHFSLLFGFFFCWLKMMAFNFISHTFLSFRFSFFFFDFISMPNGRCVCAHFSCCYVESWRKMT